MAGFEPSHTRSIISIDVCTRVSLLFLASVTPLRAPILFLSYMYLTIVVLASIASLCSFFFGIIIRKLVG